MTEVLDTKDLPATSELTAAVDTANNDSPEAADTKDEVLVDPSKATEPVLETHPTEATPAADVKEEKPGKDAETETDASLDSVDDSKQTEQTSSTPVVSSSKKSRPPYKYDPNKITLRFLFANRDGLTVTVECKPADTIGEVKGALMSVWPDDIPFCSGGESLRLVCMGKGYLMPDTRTLEDCQIPVFKTHPTPVNVSVKPKDVNTRASKKKNQGHDASGARRNASSASGAAPAATQGCCVIL